MVCRAQLVFFETDGQDLENGGGGFVGGYLRVIS
jgi:hypothetical protein